MPHYPEGLRGPVYTIDELIERRLTGWKGEDWIFLSMLGNISLLDGRAQVERADHYHGLHGCAVIIVASRSTANDGFKVVEELIQAGVANLGFWQLELPKIAELVFYGTRHKTALNLFLGDREWEREVREISQGLAA